MSTPGGTGPDLPITDPAATALDEIAPGPTPLPIASARDAWRVVWRSARTRPWSAVWAVLATALAGLAGIVGPYAVGTVVDRLTVAPDGDAVIRAGITMVVAAVAGGLFTWWGRRAISGVGETVVAELRAAAVTRALRIDAARIERAGTGELVSRVADDARLVATAVGAVVPTCCVAVMSVAISALGLIGLDWRLGLVGLTALPMYAISVRWYLPRSGPQYAAERAALARRSAQLLGAITGSDTVRALGSDRVELRRINTASATARDLALRVFRLLTGLFARNNRAEAVVLGLILGSGFLFVAAGWVGAGAVATAALLFHRLFTPLGGIVVLFDQVQSAGASLVRLVGVIQLPDDPGGRPDPVAGSCDTAGRSRLAAVDLRHRYSPDGREAVAGVDFAVEAGQIVALVGTTGAGKTTVAHVMAGVLAPTGGCGCLDGVDVRALEPAALRRRVVLVSQEVYVFAGTIADNLRLARPDADDEALWAALETALAADWVRALPEAVHTVVGDGGRRLTTVQAQHLALARIALADPDFVVLDEATAEAGSSGSHLLERASAAVLAGRGALVVAHRLSQARRADRIIVLEAGRIAEDGSHDELVAAGGRYAELWQAWSGHS